MNRKESIRIHINHALTIHIQYPIQPNQAEISNIQSKIKIQNSQKSTRVSSPNRNRNHYFPSHGLGESNAERENRSQGCIYKRTSMQSYTRCSRVKSEKECVFFFKKRKSQRTAESEIAEKKKFEGYNGGHRRV